jgi:uncharacterized Zn-binding protein involved in type VI secretion
MAAPTPHVGGVVLAGEPSVCIGGVPSARLGDPVTCTGAPAAGNVVARGSASVLINSLPAARLGDLTAHGGVIASGEPTVLIGD